MNNNTNLQLGDIVFYDDYAGRESLAVVALLGEGQGNYFDGVYDCKAAYTKKYGLIDLFSGRQIWNKHMTDFSGIDPTDLPDSEIYVEIYNVRKACNSSNLMPLVKKMNEEEQARKCMMEALALFNHPTMLSLAASRF